MIVTVEVQDLELVRGLDTPRSNSLENDHSSQPLEVQIAVEVEHGCVPVSDSDGSRNSLEPSANHVCYVAQRPIDEGERVS